MASITTTKTALIFLMISFFLVQTVNAQDDPDFDNTFGMTRPSVSPELMEREVITSDEGYDNFFLGIDFAEPHMAANPKVPTEYLNSFNAGTNVVHYTHDGHDWMTATPFFGVTERGDPVIAYDSIGNVHYELMYGSGNILGCKVITSTDNGLTWSSAVTSISGVDKNWIAADQTSGPYANYVYTTMSRTGGYNFTRSTDLGQTWTQTGSFTHPNRLPGCMVAVGPNTIGGDVPGGAVYVVTNHTSTFSPIYSFYISTDGGATFTLKSNQQFANYVGSNVNGRHSVENMRTRPYPFITADNSYGPYRGRLYVIYASNNPVGNGNKPDIYCRYSDDQGVSWSTAVTVNDDPNSTANHQFMPATWCDKETGRLYIKWFDTRNVPTSDSAEVYASYSDDGGLTWAENQNLSTSKFKIDCSTCGGGGTPRYQGDYDAIVSNQITSLSVWSDFRNGAFGSYVAYFPDFAMTVSTDSDTLKPTDNMQLQVRIPGVKLYDHSVKFSATVDPPENFNFTFPQGDSLTAFPDSLPMNIDLNNVAEGIYTVYVSGTGPNGTPVHRRTVTILVTNPTTTLLQPNGGEELFVGSGYAVTWEKIFIDTTKLEYSTDGGTSWIVITENADKFETLINHPKRKIKSDVISDQIETSSQYLWVVPNTVSSDCLLRVSDKNDPGVFDVSDAPFTIVTPPSPIWREQTSGIDTTILCIDFVDTLLAWAGARDGKVLKTTDGGLSWNVSSSSLGGDVYSISAIDNQRAFVIVNSPEMTRIRRTISFGISWGTVYEDTTQGAFLNAIHMFDENNGYAVGDPVNGEWTLLRTSDEGATWSSASTVTQNGSETGWPNSMDWIGEQYGWFGTDDGRIYYTTNNGTDWLASTTSFTNSMGIAFSDESTGIASGDGTDRTSDGGITWNISPYQIAGISFSGTAIKKIPGRWYFVSGSEVFKSNDHGDSFTLDYTQSNTLQHINMKVVQVGDNEWICGYAVGDNGTILKYTEPYSVADIQNDISLLPDKFTLLQNYPNPFNPSTTIKFSLPVSSEVRLIVYNMLGQKVATLINGQRSAGTHSVQWNSSNNSGVKLSSGIYLYKLEANGTDGIKYSEIKKMILVK